MKKKNEISIRSSAAEYLTFIAATGDDKETMVAHLALPIGGMPGRLGIGHSHSQGHGRIYGGDLLVGSQVGDYSDSHGGICRYGRNSLIVSGCGHLGGIVRGGARIQGDGFRAYQEPDSTRPFHGYGQSCHRHFYRNGHQW